MAAEPFLKGYLYGAAAAASGNRSPGCPEPPAIPNRRAPAHLAKRFAQIIQGLMVEVLEPHGLTSQQWGVMVAIVREPGCDQRGVAQRQSIDVNSVSRVVDELEALGLVQRVASPTDRRANGLQLTPAGVRMRAKLQGPVIAAQDRALDCLEQTEKRTLLDLLTRVVEANKGYARPGVGRRKPVKKTVALQPGQAA